MHALFLDARAFNGDVMSWDVSNVESAHHMFRKAKSFNQDILSWNVSSMWSPVDGIFDGADAFHHDIIFDWNITITDNMEVVQEWNFELLENEMQVFGVSFINLPDPLQYAHK
jgi:hypothetical protein